MRDFTQPVRKAVLRELKGVPAITALVPAERIFPPLVPGGLGPVFPFIRYGTSTVTPFSASCMNGCSIATTLHSFAKGGDESATVIRAAIIDHFGGETGRDSGFVLDIDVTDTRAFLYVLGGPVLPDGADQTAWQAIANLRIDVSA